MRSRPTLRERSSLTDRLAGGWLWCAFTLDGGPFLTPQQLDSPLIVERLPLVRCSSVPLYRSVKTTLARAIE